MKETDRSAAPQNVIVVNDDVTQLNILSSLLKKAGKNVISCTRVDEALSKMKTLDFLDLIVTDLHMPDIDGWRFCRLLRSPEYPQYNQTPILVVSATFSGENPHRITTELGANGFLPAPIDGVEFLKYANMILNGETPQFSADVVIVDDSKTICRKLKTAFNNHKYNVRCALTGEEGLSLIKSQPADIFILDYHLPDMYGDELLPVIKELYPQSIIIIITADTNPDLALKWMKGGVNEYLRKPFDPEYLVSRCENALHERSLLGVVDLLEERTRELSESEQRFRYTFEQAAVGIVHTAIDGAFQLLNQRFCQITGYSREELLKKDFQQITHPDDIEKDLENVKRLLAAEINTFSMEKRYISKYKSIVWVNLTVSLVSDDKNQPDYFIAIVEDITERKLAEVERRRLETRIMRAQKFESLNIMAGSIAHNFNNLLTGVLGNLELATLSLSDEAQTFQRIKEAETAARRAADLSTLMLTYVGQSKVNIQQIELNELLIDMTGMLEWTKSRRSSLNLRLSPQPVYLKGDVSHIRQIVISLVTNASEALGTKGGSITISSGIMFCDRSYFQQSFFNFDLPKGTYSFLEVSDNGPGMDEDLLTKVFDPFFTTKFTGRGLGLAAVLGIVRTHKGAIAIDSRPGKGTTVRILFPELKKPKIIKKKAAEAETTWRGSGTVLVVDDEKMVLNVAKRMFSILGFEVILALSGKEAINKFKKDRDKIDFVLLDLTMPGMDGIETLTKLRGIDKEIKVILSSGYTEEQVAVKCTDDIPSAFIQKPYIIAKLSKKIQDILKDNS